MRIKQGSPIAHPLRDSFGQIWALVLAGGEGSRLRQLTTIAGGASVPKQFCSLTGGRTLLEDAIERAHGVASPERTCTIVSHHHRQWWSALLANELPENVIVQPRGRGTGIGILFSALHIAARDPEARIVILPADHHVCAESILRARLQDALERLDSDDAPPTLLGLSPDRIDTELGYIVPAGESRNSLQSVARFIEKPDRDKARDSIADGALWNTFIMATPVRSLVRLFMKCYSVLMLEMQAIVTTALQATPAGTGWQLLVDMYDRLPNIDFSKDLLQKHPDALRVLSVPECGWSDLGTPNRLGETLRRLPPRMEVSPAAPFINLAAQHALYEHHMASAIRPS
ncbi:mannose-1-phosphate guanylyltransferase [Povalibacter uvarum]|uniref:Mannose-1-phosphate guanylyltransferase n=1 Tax=Povalibacter uvarum TaxID=732238 RepID=A0A841HMD2_9GAMM|nr:sugar phosphate nucleotidyltransferase [Povalibacter uvarum]MBB6094026.1 mannose-1-phosphate guanylyltransferase [Povalibacter uvarum]